MFQESSEIPVAKAVDQQEEDPYASPLTAGQMVATGDPDAPVGIWRHGVGLLMHRDAMLPERCILTNEKCDQAERRVYTFDSRWKYYIPGAIVLIASIACNALLITADSRKFIPVGIGSFLMLLLVIRICFARRFQELKVFYSYSSRARQRRLNFRCGGLVLFCIGFFCFPLSVAFLWLPVVMITLVIGGMVLLLVGGIMFAAFGFPLRFQGAEPYVVIQGCGRTYMQNFPDSSVAGLGLANSLAKQFPLRP